MLILVVHNSSHHADNVLRLGEEIARIDPHTNLVVLCERKDFERLTKIISNPETRIFALGQNGHQTLQFVDGVTPQQSKFFLSIHLNSQSFHPLWIVG